MGIFQTARYRVVRGCDTNVRYASGGVCAARRDCAASLEVLLGIMLVVGYKTRAASLLSMILMGVFAVAIAVNAARGASFDCGCLELGRFGISENISMTLAARNIVLILAFLLVFNLRKNVLSIDARIERGTLRDI